MLQPDLDFGLEQTDCEYLLSSLSLVDQGFRRCVICGSIIHFDASVMGRVCGALKRVDIVTYNTFISVISGFFMLKRL